MFTAAQVSAQGPISIGATSSSALRLENGNTEINGKNVPTDQLWEKVLVNTGNTHLVSGQIMAGAVQEAAAPAPAGAHPAYLHALSDMRLARALLMGWTNPLIMIPMREAVSETENAINEIVAAAISDGKNIDDHPPIDAALANRDRLNRSLELLNKAYSDIDQKETNPMKKGHPLQKLIRVK